MMQFYGPKGNVKATVRLRNYNVVWGHAVSQDGRLVTYLASAQSCLTIMLR
jgi:hypothetical protein